jgi:hypothetical protein
MEKEPSPEQVPQVVTPPLALEQGLERDDKLLSYPMYFKTNALGTKVYSM